MAKALIQNQFNPELFAKTGLVVERNGEWQDNYRDRIIFPIHNTTGKVIGFGYCVPEQLTEGTFNLLAIAVQKNLQGNGLGKQMIHYLENYLNDGKHRVLIIETSSHPDFALTQKFYLNLNYSKVATIPDFWKEGEDKVVFWKKLN